MIRHATAEEIATVIDRMRQAAKENGKYVFVKPTKNSGAAHASAWFSQAAFSSGHDLRLLEKGRINLNA
jgi:hypothetical protein